MYLKCLYSNLAEISGLDISTLSDIPNNLDEDIGLEKGQYYRIIGAIFGPSFIRLYILDEDMITAVLPIYFDFSWKSIPNGWEMRLNTRTNMVEVLPKALTLVEDWFERYVDDDEEVINIISEIIKSN